MPAGGKQNSPEVLNFLNQLGTKDKGDGSGLKLNRTAKTLIELGEYLILEAQENMTKAKSIATGRIADSMEIKNLSSKSAKFSLDVVIDKNYKWTNDGVRGVNGGSGKYQFKTTRPSKKMATTILKWARKRGLKGRTKYSPASGNEGKDVGIRKLTSSSDNLKSLAYAISTNIKKKGIQPTHFFTKAIKATEKIQREKYATAFKLDIIDSIEDLNDN